MRYTPNEFVEKLDEKIISQKKAKETIAVALRNRWRRTQLNKEISKLITPKNILLIGSTGVGKTALIRALADIIDAPMIKVEATKYTQVGYVGESVNQMIEALAIEGYAKYTKAKQSKYSKDNDYNKFLLVKKANYLIREIEKLVRKEIDAVYKEYYESDIVSVELKKENCFYSQKDIDDFNGDYEKNDHKLIDWIFSHSLVVEVLMLGLNLVPKRHFEEIKQKAKREKVKRDLTDALYDIFKENKLLSYLFSLILYPNRPSTFFENDSAVKLDNINSDYFKQILEILEEKLDKKCLPYFQSYINYIYSHIDETPFIYEPKKTKEDKKVKDDKSSKKESKSKQNDKTVEEKSDKFNKLNPKGAVAKPITDLFKDHISYTENMGIVFIDEIDKLAENPNSSSKDNIGKQGVQRDLLAILDGTTIDTTKGPICTDNILFIAAGAFHVSSTSDLMPELLGRLPITVKLEDMNVNLLESILKNKLVSPINQYVHLLSADNITVEYDESLLRKIAILTHNMNKSYRNMGARTLQLVVDRLFSKYATETATAEDNRLIKITDDDINRVRKEFNRSQWKENLKRYFELQNKLKFN